MKYLLVLFSLGITQLSIAQETVEMADAMRADGKIYVVVAVISIILTGLFVYLFTIDRKVSKLEKNN